VIHGRASTCEVVRPQQGSHKYRREELIPSRGKSLSLQGK
jgi:hypothetical protein